MTGPWNDPGRMNRRRFLAWSLGAGAAVLGLPRMARAASSFMETARCWRVMGTLIEVRVPDLPPAEALDAIRRVRRRVEAMEAAMTLFRPKSPLVALNAARPGEWMPVPAGLVAGLAAGRDGARRYRGLYDPTVGPLMRALGLQDLVERPDDPEFRARWRGRPGPKGLELDPENHRARRLDPRVEYDLGGVGKGMAVDAALAVLAEAGSSAALVNLGGSIGVLGPPPQAPRGWAVGIADPLQPGEILRTLFLGGGHLATSGDYERRVPGGRHHLLDPESGVSAPGVASITVWSPTGSDADLLSTAGFVARSRGERDPGKDFFCLLKGRSGLEPVAGGCFARGGLQLTPWS